MDEQTQGKNNLALVSDIVSSYLRRNSVGVDEIGRVVSNVTTAMRDAEKVISGGGSTFGNGMTEDTTAETKEPAVSVRASIRPDYLVCLDCGAKMKTMKRHLMNAHGLTPAQYRERWDLKSDYPMTAPAYSESRSAMAKSLGLGRKPGEGRKQAKKAAPRRSTTKKPAAKTAA